jgi:hypothetical protein
LSGLPNDAAAAAVADIAAAPAAAVVRTSRRENIVFSLRCISYAYA